MLEETSTLFHPRVVSPSQHNILESLNPMYPVRSVLADVNRLDGPTNLTRKDVTNHRQDTICAKFLGEDSCIEGAAREYGDRYFIQVNEDPLCVLISNKETISLGKRYASMLIMDSTYSTNRFHMPLFTIAVKTCTNSTLVVAHIFMTNENNAAYKVALMMFYIVFPVTPSIIVTDQDKALLKAIRDLYTSAHHLLCWFHIKQNLNGYKRSVEESKWKTFVEMFDGMVYESTEETAATMWEEMNRKFSADEQLAPCRKLLALPCRQTEALQYENYRQSQKCTQCTESNFSNDLKGCYGVNASNTRVHFSAVSRLQRTVADDKSAVDRRLVNNDFFQNVVRKVSSFALNDLLCSLESLDQRIPECSQWNRTVNGLPCKHELVELISNDSALTLEDFDHEWWLNVSAPALLNPLEQMASMYTTADNATRSCLEQIMLSGIQTPPNKYPKPDVIQQSGHPSSTLSDESATQSFSHSPPRNNTKRTTCTKRIPLRAASAVSLDIPKPTRSFIHNLYSSFIYI
ncbi:hypothetical protein GEMRC1_009781 [Eukaryota sp. GEM-RC1]